MNCSNPYTNNGEAFGCGQCIACRINKRREWTHRLILESCLHSDNAFITLTHDDESYPDDHSVHPRSLQLFLKRLRKRYPKPLRYFGVGEYGTLTMRPHYHLILFGYPNCEWGATTYQPHSTAPRCCAPCELIHEAWRAGRIQVAEFSPATASYCCGYVTKKLTKKNDDRLEGRLPEFARMSLRPGIGHDMMHDLASQLMTLNLETKLIDVPHELQHGKVKYPLGPYLRRKLRRLVGLEEATPPLARQAQKEKLRAVRETAFLSSTALKKQILKESLGRRIQLEQKSLRDNRKQTL